MMKAVSCLEGNLSVVELLTPQPAAGQLLLDVRRCGICGTDLHAKDHSDETIEVFTSCGELRGASLDMIQQARRGEEVLVRAELVVACMGEGGRPVRLPPHLRTALAQVTTAKVSSGGSPRSRHIQV